jgi:hypothetical protein
MGIRKMLLPAAALGLMASGLAIPMLAVAESRREAVTYAEASSLKGGIDCSDWVSEPCVQPGYESECSAATCFRYGDPNPKCLYDTSNAWCGDDDTPCDTITELLARCNPETVVVGK